MKISTFNDRNIFSKKKDSQNAEDCIVDIDAIRAVYPESPDLIRELITIYLSEVPQRMTSLAQAVEEKDIEQILYLSHLIKGMSGNLSITPLQEVYFQIEQMARDKAIEGVDKVFREVSLLFEQAKAELEEMLALDKI